KVGSIESMTWRSTDSFKIQGAGSPTIIAHNRQSHKPAPAHNRIQSMAIEVFLEKYSTLTLRVSSFCATKLRDFPSPCLISQKI
ncbi:hypothetical protein, partial [Microcoleus sp. D3_18a_C4]|uniref:hypothetical protein n=1 Tax=Microcoleus sp. D3_18a_C4 TaxID=3055332 RepID=UPI002FD6B1D8